MVGPLHLVCKQHKLKLEKKNSKVCKEEEQKAKTKFKISQ